MPRRALLSSSAFRLALSLSAVLACAMAFAFLAVYVLVGHQLRNGLVTRIDAETAELVAVWQRGGLEALRHAVDQRAAGSPGGNTALVLQDPSGIPLAGNVGALEPFDGHTSLRRRSLAIDPTFEDVDDEDMFLLSGAMLGGHFVAAGESNHDLLEVQEILTTGFASALLATITLILTTAYLLSGRMRSRIAAIRLALERVADGDLAQLIPGAESGDDVGEVVRLVNKTVHDLSVVLDSVQKISIDIAHDLKRPLGRLRHHLTVAEAHAGVESRKHLLYAQDQAKNIQSLFEALLRIAQIESGARRAAFRAVDLTDLLRNVYEIFEPVARESGHRFQLNPLSAQQSVLGDKELLTQLLVNLIENGICHTPSGSVIELACAGSGSGTYLTVSDNGPGVSDEARDRLTQRFFRCDASRTDGGTGLGLSLVAAVASLHDARIEFADNHPGLTVRVYFPASPRTSR